MSVDDGMKQKIKKWIELDVAIQEQNAGIRELRNEKNELEQEITSYAEKNDIYGTKITTSDSILSFSYNTTKQALSMKFVKDCLQDIIQDQSNVEKIMQYIEDKRSVKKEQCIKRKER